MNVTLKQLKELGACQEALQKYFIVPGIESIDAKELLELAINNRDYGMARWGLSHLMTVHQQKEWSIYCAMSVLHIFESKYMDDKRPRMSIKAAKAALKNPTDTNKKAAYATSGAAADAAADAAYAAADAAADAADAAADAADAASYAAYAAAYAADAAYAAADAAADAAYAAADAADAAANKKLLRHGLKILLRGGK